MLSAQLAALLPQLGPAQQATHDTALSPRRSSQRGPRPLLVRARTVEALIRESVSGSIISFMALRPHGGLIAYVPVRSWLSIPTLRGNPQDHLRLHRPPCTDTGPHPHLNPTMLSPNSPNRPQPRREAHSALCCSQAEAPPALNLSPLCTLSTEPM